MTARIGGFSFRHPWLVLATWVLILAGGAFAGGVVLGGLENDQGFDAESTRAGDVLSEARQRQPDEETGGRLVGLIEGVDIAAPATTSTIMRESEQLAEHEYVATVEGVWPAKDGSGLALFLTLEPDLSRAQILQVSDELRAVATDLPGATVRVGGGAVLQDEVNDLVARDLANSELRGLPLTFVVLIIVFGGLVAAGVPLLATLVTLAGGFAVLLGFSTFVTLDQNVVTVVTLLSLGLSIDYGLLLVARYREELVSPYLAALARGEKRIDRRTRGEAVARAWATAGRTIMFSGLTIAAAMCGLLAVQIDGLQAMAAGGIAAALVAVGTGLTFTAALLSVFGRGIRPSRRSLRKAQTANGDDERGFFAALARFTQRWPIPVALMTVAVLLAAGLPLLRLNPTIPNLDGLPNSVESVAVSKQLVNQYDQVGSAVVRVVARTDAESLDDWAARWTSDPAVSRVEAADAVGDVAVVTLVLRGDDQDAAARALVERVRADRPPGVESWVTGQAALLIDVLDVLARSLPWAAALTIVAMLVLLFLMTGSIIVPIKAIIMGVLSLGASFGVLVLLFQDGHLAGPLDTLTVGGLSPFVMAVVFAFAFGLSMDYEVFLLGRVKEYVDAGMHTDAAVRRGLQHTGRIITTAALLMLIVFGAFGLAEISDIEQIGVGLFIAVLVDATIVRCLLVPATMTLLGRWNWWAPAPLRRLHQRLHLSESVPPPSVAHSTVASVPVP